MTTTAVSSFGVGSLHEFVGWLQGRVPLDHFSSANIAIDAAAVSDGQFGIGRDVLRSAVWTEKVAAIEEVVLVPGTEWRLG